MMPWSVKAFCVSAKKSAVHSTSGPRTGTSLSSSSAIRIRWPIRHTVMVEMSAATSHRSPVSRPTFRQSPDSSLTTSLVASWPENR